MKRALFGIAVIFALIAGTWSMGVVQTYAETIPGIANRMNYQGWMTDTDGTPKGGDFNMVFSIYDDATNGVNWWTETRNGSTSPVHVTKGWFNVLLGQYSPTSLSALPFDKNYWLKIQVMNGGGQYETIGRDQISSKAYAFNANMVRGPGGTDNIFPSSGKVGVGDTSPDASLEVVNSFFVSQTSGADGNWFCVTGGNVGIGTAAPVSKLEVRGEVKSVVGGVEFFMVPKGGIILWSGTVANIPASWQLCNGTNGAPNLTDRFIVGAGTSYASGTTGGASTVDHTHSAGGYLGPSHSHVVNDHSHTIPNHSHTMSNHVHPGPNHAHDMQSHTHSVTGTTGGGCGDYNQAFVNVVIGQNGTWPLTTIQHYHSPLNTTVGGPVPSNTGSGGSGSTLGPTNNATTESSLWANTVTGLITQGPSNPTITGNSGSASNTENRPPYYALCYIMKM